MGAKELGIKTIFMTTGKYREEELKRTDFKPDYLFRDLQELENKIFRVAKGLIIPANCRFPVPER
ncbi:MAG: HAD hydrolase-like protein [Aquificota bacterium]|nr:HAD hydrolase-like protein [Aquificota bacterium]